MVKHLLLLVNSLTIIGFAYKCFPDNLSLFIYMIIGIIIGIFISVFYIIGYIADENCHNHNDQINQLTEVLKESYEWAQSEIDRTEDILQISINEPKWFKKAENIFKENK